MAEVIDGALRILDQTLASTDAAITRATFKKHVLRGTRFEWVANAQVRLVPSGADGQAQVPMSDGSSVKGFTVTSNTTADITSSGANGLDTGAEAASTFYYVWGIGKSDGTFALLLSVSSSSPTMPSGYTFKRLLWGVSNNASSNFCTFVHLRDGKCMYTQVEDNSVRGLAVLTSGTATSATAVSMARAVPDVAIVLIGLAVRASNANNTNSVFTASFDSGQTLQPFNGRTVGQTGLVCNMEHWENVHMRNTGSIATSFYYKWATNSGSQQCFVYVQWWNIGVRW